MKPSPGRFRASATAAFQMLGARSVRTALATTQFTVGFAALVVLVVTIVSAQRVTSALSATFEPTSVIGLHPMVSHTAGPEVFIGPDDLTAISELASVREAAVVWYAFAALSDGRQIRVVALNSAAEDMIGVRVVDAWGNDVTEGVSELRSDTVFLTRQAVETLGLGRTSGSPAVSLEFTILGRVFEAIAVGVVTPRAGWPPRPLPGSLSAVEFDLPAIVLSLEAVRDMAHLQNSIWLELRPGSTPETAALEVSGWHRERHPTSSLRVGVVSVRDEIARQAAVRRPETWVAGLLSVTLLLLSSLGFAGQTMIMSEARRLEWALRMSLGATRAHLVIQLAIETVTVIALAALFGLLLGLAAVGMVLNTGRVPALFGFGPAALIVLAACLALTALSAVMPILRVSREEASTVMKEAG